MKSLLVFAWLAEMLGSQVLSTADLAPSPLVSHVSPAPRAGYDWPLKPVPQVFRSFSAPPQPWAAGHRGVDLLSSDGADVLAAGPGVVSHSGVIAGRGTVTVTHPNGWRTTYEPVDDRVAAGTRVVTGDRLATLSTTSSHCSPRACLHWGLVIGDRHYRDPLTLVTSRRVVLLPVP